MYFNVEEKDDEDDVNNNHRSKGGIDMGIADHSSRPILTEG